MDRESLTESEFCIGAERWGKIRKGIMQVVPPTSERLGWVNASLEGRRKLSDSIGQS